MMMAQLAASRMRALPLAMVQGKLGAVWDFGGDFNPNWRRNLLTYSEDFSNAAWAKVNATFSAGVLTATTAGGKAQQNVTVSPGSTIFIDVIKGTADTVEVDTGVAAFLDVTVFNLATLTYTLRSNNDAASITDLGSGVLRLSVTRGATAGNRVSLAIPVIGQTVLPVRAQLERGAATAYQRITDVSTEYIAAVGMPTLWQDYTGITPVTALEQSVGAIFDRSKGLALGAERFAGSFDSTGAGWSYSGGVLTATADSGGQSTYANIATNLTRYLVTFHVTVTSGTLQFHQSGSLIANITASGTYTYRSMGSGGNSRLQFTSSSFVGSITSISVREVAGIHLHQPTADNRGVLSARFNQATNTEVVAGGAPWGAALYTIQNNSLATGIPTGQGPAYLSKVTATASPSASTYSSGNAPATAFRVRFFVSIGTRPTLNFMIRNGTSATVVASATFNGSVLSATVGAAWGATAMGGGVYQITVDVSSGFAATDVLQVYYGATGATPEGLYWYVGGMDIRSAADTLLNIPPYQRVNSATDYDYAGFPCYINCAGNKWYTNPAVDMSSTDKVTPFVGITKLVTSSMIMEFSANATATNGTFYLYAPGNYYEFRSGGAAGFGSAGGAGAGSTPVPHTASLVCIGDISGDKARMLLNGVEIPPGTTNQGTGNFTSQPLYVGARAGTSLFFNGRLFYGGLLGEVASSAFIENLDRWSKQRMRRP